MRDRRRNEETSADDRNINNSGRSGVAIKYKQLPTVITPTTDDGDGRLSRSVPARAPADPRGSSGSAEKGDATVNDKEPQSHDQRPDCDTPCSDICQSKVL